MTAERIIIAILIIWCFVLQANMNAVQDKAENAYDTADDAKEQTYLNSNRLDEVCSWSGYGC